MHLRVITASLCAALLAVSCTTGSNEQDLLALASDIAASASPTVERPQARDDDAAARSEPTPEPTPSAGRERGVDGSTGQAIAASESSDPSDRSGDNGNDEPSQVPLSAEVTPTCVVPGEEMELVVTTTPETATLYHAVYAGEESGADRPIGDGHGGNDGGFSDADGRYESSWTVSVDAPAGPARVDVMVTTSETSLPFEVADPLTRQCG